MAPSVGGCTRIRRTRSAFWRRSWSARGPSTCASTNAALSPIAKSRIARAIYRSRRPWSGICSPRNSERSGVGRQILNLDGLDVFAHWKIEDARIEIQLRLECALDRLGLEETVPLARECQVRKRQILGA